MADAEPMFPSAAAVRAANRPLLDRFDALDPDGLPADFLAEIEAFRTRAAATGVILSSVEDRSETQTAINFWTTILFGAAGRPAPAVLAPFDKEAARARIGDAPPYKGLEPFQIEDKDNFFGRNKAIAEMLGKLADHRLIAVLGLSGSGKSSVVRAGLIPRLSQGAAPGSEEWRILEPIVPGRSPVQALAEVVSQLETEPGTPSDPESFVAALDRTGRRVLVSIDQFEELFTLDPPEDEKRRFLDMLAAAATTGAHAHIVLLTMRSEFDTRLRRYEAFDTLFEAGRVQIPALSPAELRSAIQQPAEQAGLSFESGLPEELVQAVVGEPAGLPLLQFTLLELWNRRSGNQLTWDAYEELGRNPREILARRADEVYRGFALQEDRDISQRIFLALVQIGSGLEATSRRVLRSDLDTAVGRGRDNVDRVVGKWRENGLIRVSPPGGIRSVPADEAGAEAGIHPDSQIEIAHEALIRNWSRLSEWIEDAFASTRRRRLLTEQALAWKEGKAGLLGELSLKEAETYDSLSDDERDYVGASRASIDEQNRKIRRRNRIAVVGMVAMALLSLLASASTIFAIRNGREIAAAQGKAESARIAAERATLRSRRTEEAARIGGLFAAQRLHDATERVRVAETQLATLRVQEANMRRELQRTLARRSEVRTSTAAEEVKLARLREEAETLRRERDAAQVEAQAARTERDAAQEETEAARASAAQVFEALGRPALRFENGRLAESSPDWPRLDANRANVERLARSVGRLQGNLGPNLPYRGTTFLVADGVAVVLRYELADRTNVEGLTIDFRDQPDGDTRHAFAVQGIIGETRSLAPQLSLVFLRVARRNGLGEALPPPLQLAPFEMSSSAVTASAEPRPVYVLGYPSRDPRQPEEVNRAILGDLPGVKRVAPGYLQSFGPTRSGNFQLGYDSTTFGGTAGSPIVDLNTGRVIGIHHSGGLGQTRYGTAFTPDLLASDAFRRAGVRAGSSRDR